MATVDEKGALDGGATSSLEGKENKPLGDATPTAVAGAQDGAQDGTPEIVYPSMTSFSLIALALCLIIYVITLDSTVLATAVPVITDEFDSLKDVGWYSSVYFNDDRHHTTSLQAPECAIFTAVAQTLFANELATNLGNTGVPGVDTSSVLTEGVTTLTRGLEGDDKIAVLEALNDANVDSWKLPLALCCVSIIGAVTV